MEDRFEGLPSSMSDEERLAFVASFAAQSEEEVSTAAILFDLVGVEATMKILLVFGGKVVRFPDLKSFPDNLEVARGAVFAHINKTSVEEACRELRLYGLEARVAQVLEVLETYEKQRRRAITRERQLLDELGI